MKKRVLIAFIGIVLAGVSVSFSKMAAFGVDPFQVLMTGVNSVVPISYGAINALISAVLALFALIFDRHYLNIGTVFCIVAVGYVIDYSHKGLQMLFPEVNMAGRIIFLLIAIVTCCFAAALYYEADLGVSPYDTLSLIMGYKWKILPYRFCRIITDICCVGCGVLAYVFSGEELSSILSFLGCATIILAFGMGPLVEFFREKIVKPYLFSERASHSFA